MACATQEDIDKENMQEVSNKEGDYFPCYFISEDKPQVVDYICVIYQYIQSYFKSLSDYVKTIGTEKEKNRYWGWTEIREENKISAG